MKSYGKPTKKNVKTKNVVKIQCICSPSKDYKHFASYMPIIPFSAHTRREHRDALESMRNLFGMASMDLIICAERT